MFPYRKLFTEPSKAPFYAYFYLVYAHEASAGIQSGDERRAR